MPALQKKGSHFSEKRPHLSVRTFTVGGFIRQVELTKIYKLTMMFGIGHKKAKFI
jgi:hypothetical protein